MKCQNCGNELGQEEVFCGQCGAPNVTPAQPTEMMQSPVPRSGLLGDAYHKRTNVSSPDPSQSNPMPGPQQSAFRQPLPQQTGGFYQDATEALPYVPGTPTNHPSNTYAQQGFNNSSMGGGYPGASQIMQQSQQFLPGNHSNSNYSTQMGFPGGQFSQGGYGSGAGLNQQGPKRGNVVMIVGIVCLVFAIITVGVFGALFALRNGNQSPSTPVAQTTATAIPTATPNPTPSPTPSPTPTVAPTATAAPDDNFNWCSTQCTQADQSTTYAAVKLPTGSSSTSDLINNDLQEIASQNSASAGQLSACSSNQAIGGSSWTCQTATLQPNDNSQQQLQANIYATIYQNKAYVIEIVAQQGSFSDAQGTYFTPMLNSFQFVSAG